MPNIPDIDTLGVSAKEKEDRIILQSVMEMQNKLGQLTQAITTLTEESKKNSAKIDDISHKF